MTTTTIMRTGALSRNMLLEVIFRFYNDGETEAAEIFGKADEVIRKVNNALPGSLYWSASTSEIWVDVNDATRITKEEFDRLFNEAFAEVVYK